MLRGVAERLYKRDHFAKERVLGLEILGWFGSVNTPEAQAALYDGTAS